jgi:spore germination protein KC
MKKTLCVALIIMLMLLLTGCWSRQEPKTLALVNSVIYDLGIDETYKVTIEVINPSAQGGPQGNSSGKSPNITAMGMGVSIPETIRSLSESLDRAIFGGHNKVRFFSEQFAQNDITLAMDYVLRDPLTDENPLMVVIRNEEPNRIYTCLLGLSDTVGDYLEGISETQPNTMSQAVFINTLDFVKAYYDEGRQPVTGVVELVECESKPSKNTVTETDGSQGDEDVEYKIVYKGLAAFKDKKLVGYMDAVETRAYNIVVNNAKKAVVSIVWEESETVVLTQNPKAEIKTELNDGRATVNIEIKAKLSVLQENGMHDISDPEALKVIEAAFNEQLAGEISAAVQRAQLEFKSDIFGFGQALHRQNPGQWREIKDDWDYHFSKAEVNVSVKSEIDRSGEIKHPFGLGDRQ